MKLKSNPSTGGQNIRFYRLIGLVTVLWLVASVLFYGKYSDIFKGGGDAWGYYIYLPTTFISGDWETLDYVTQKRKELRPHSIDYSAGKHGFLEVYTAENGHPVIKYTSGVALMLSPFFLVAHAICGVFSSLSADGFNTIYWLSVYLGTIFWVLLGCVLLFKVLNRYFSTGAAFFTVLLILLGTNLYYFTVYNLMSHAPLFALYCILIYVTDNFYKSSTWYSGFLIGIICGLICMIRPTEIICVFIPLLWNIGTLSDRFSFLISRYKILLQAVLGGFISIFPQLLYWKVTSGSWIHYSYGDEGFNFLKPYIRRGLTSFQNGWLIYTPIMCFAVFGLIILYRKYRGVFIPVMVFTAVHIYIIYCWHNWYYINSFGSRPMVEAYALLAFPFAAFLQYFCQGWKKYLLISGSLFFVLLNQFQTFQVSKAIMHSEEGSWSYYQSIFGKTKMTESMLITADTQERQPEPESLDSAGVLWSHEFTQSALLNKDTTSVIRLSPQHTPRIEQQLGKADIRPGDYIKISVAAKAGGWNADRWKMATTGILFEKEGATYLFKWNRINNKLGNPTWNLWGGVPDVWGEAWFFVQVPEKYTPDDKILVWAENTGVVPVELKSFQVELWRRNI